MKLFVRFWTFITTVAIVRSARYVDPCGRSDQCNHNPFPTNNEISPSPYNCSLYDSCQLGGIWRTFSCNVTHRWFDMLTLECESQTTIVACQPPCANTSTSVPDSIVGSTSSHNPRDYTSQSSPATSAASSNDTRTNASIPTPPATGSDDIGLIVGLCVGLGVPAVAAGGIAIILYKKKEQLPELRRNMNERFRNWCGGIKECSCHNKVEQNPTEVNNKGPDESPVVQQTTKVGNDGRDGSRWAQPTGRAGNEMTPVG